VENRFSATEQFELEIDLRRLVSKTGEYDVTITPENEFGKSKEIFFVLRVKSAESGFLWAIVPDTRLIKKDPSYLPCFSDDLKVVTKR
jgi:hypothetical protein